jgi:hypothetical protein
LRAVRSVFSDEKKLSIAALSHTLADRLMLQTMPLSAISRWNCLLVYWLPWSRVMQQGIRLAAPPDRHARERALLVARQDPPSGVSPDEAVAAVRDVLDTIGDTCPECPSEK